MSEESVDSERRQAFEAEAMPHLGRLYAAARRLARPGADAEDLVQETFLRAYRTYDNFERGTDCRAWLLTILYSVYSNRWRRLRREPEARPDDELERAADRDRPSGEWEEPLLAAIAAGTWGTGAVVESALRSLSEEHRRAVLLVDVEELTYEEAATALECPIGTVRSRLSRARRRLASRLAGYARELGYAGEQPR
jgi:RNA polymerase sigma-70 factor (ECF subfamily)